MISAQLNALIDQVVEGQLTYEEIMEHPVTALIYYNYVKQIPTIPCIHMQKNPLKGVKTTDISQKGYVGREDLHQWFVVNQFDKQPMNLAHIMGIPYYDEDTQESYRVIAVEADGQAQVELINSLLRGTEPTVVIQSGLYNAFRNRHYLFKVREELDVPVGAKTFEGDHAEIAVKGQTRTGTGQLLVAAPSTHKTGVNYEPLKGHSMSTVEIQELPGVLYQWLLQNIPRATKGQDINIQALGSSQIGKYLAALVRAPQGARNNAMLAYMGCVIGKGMSLEDIVSVITETRPDIEVNEILKMYECIKTQDNTEVNQKEYKKELKKYTDKLLAEISNTYEMFKKYVQYLNATGIRLMVVERRDDTGTLTQELRYCSTEVGPWKIVTRDQLTLGIQGNVAGTYEFLGIKPYMHRLYQHTPVASKISTQRCHAIADSWTSLTDIYSELDIPYLHLNTTVDKASETTMCFKSTVVDTTTGESRAWNASTDRHLASYEFAYDPENVTEEDKKRVRQYYSEIFLNPGEVDTFLEFMAYAVLTYRNDHKHFLYVYGDTNSGKSTAVRYIYNMLPKELVCAQDVTGKTNQFSATQLVNRILAFSGETKNGYLHDAQLIKGITGADMIRIEPKGKEAYSIVPTVKWVQCSNHPLKMSADETAFVYPRALVLTANNKFDIKNNPQHAEAAQIWNEFFGSVKGKSALISVLIEALLALNARGHLVETDSMKAAKGDQASSNNLESLFFNEAIEFLPEFCNRESKGSPTRSLSIPHLHSILNDIYQVNDKRRYPRNQVELCKYLEQHYPEYFRRSIDFRGAHGKRKPSGITNIKFNADHLLWFAVKPETLTSVAIYHTSNEAFTSIAHNMDLTAI